MKQTFTHYDYLRYVLFEKLFPQIIYKGSKQEQADVLVLLQQDGNHLIHFLFEELCQKDHLP